MDARLWIVWGLIVFAGACCIAAGLYLALFREHVPSPSSGLYERRDRRFAVSIGSLQVTLVFIGVVLLLIATFMAWTINGDSDSQSDAMEGTSEASPTGPAGPPNSAGTGSPTTPVQPADSATTGGQQPPPASGDAMPACDGRWATVLGSTHGQYSTPLEFLESLQSQLQDPSLTLIAANHCASITPDVWIVVGGIYASRDEALTECEHRGFADPADCYPAHLTSNAED